MICVTTSHDIRPFYATIFKRPIRLWRSSTCLLPDDGTTITKRHMSNAVRHLRQPAVVAKSIDVKLTIHLPSDVVMGSPHLEDVGQAVVG